MEDTGSRYSRPESIAYWTKAGQVARNTMEKSAEVNKDLGVDRDEEDPFDIPYPVSKSKPAKLTVPDPEADARDEEVDPLEFEDAINEDISLAGLFKSKDLDSSVDKCTEEELLHCDYPKPRSVEDQLEDLIEEKSVKMRPIPYQKEPLTKSEFWGGNGCSFVVAALDDDCPGVQALVARLQDVLGMRYHVATKTVYMDLDSISIPDQLWEYLAPRKNRLSVQIAKKDIERGSFNKCDAISRGTASSSEASYGLQVESTPSPETIEIRTFPQTSPPAAAQASRTGTTPKKSSPPLSTFKTAETPVQQKKYGLISPTELRELLSTGQGQKMLGLAIPQKEGPRVFYIPSQIALYAVKAKQDTVAPSVMRVLLETQDMAQRVSLKSLLDIDGSYWTGDLTNMVPVALARVERIKSLGL